MCSLEVIGVSYLMDAALLGTWEEPGENVFNTTPFHWDTPSFLHFADTILYFLHSVACILYQMILFGPTCSLETR